MNTADPISEPRVLCVLLHHTQPRQVEMSLAALRSQTHQCQIVVVDNHHVPADGTPDTLALSSTAADQADDVWQIAGDYGDCVRFAPAFAQHGCKYVYFHNENLVPGPKTIEFLVDEAEKLNGQFATIGQMGRRLELRQNPKRARLSSELAKQWVYPTDDVARSAVGRVMVDVTRAAHFVRADMMPSVLQFAWQLISRGQGMAEHIGLNHHDDLLLCLAIQKVTGYPSYVTRETAPEAAIQRRTLRESGDGEKRRWEGTERSRFIREAVNLGWRPLWE